MGRLFICIRWSNYWCEGILSGPEELQIAGEAGMRLGLPLVYGEYVHHGGYHNYPSDEQVRSWLTEASIILLDMAERGRLPPLSGGNRQIVKQVTNNW